MATLVTTSPDITTEA